MLLIIIFYAAIYVAIIFPLTDQPVETSRILKFSFIYVLLGAITEALSETVGVLFNPVVSLANYFHIHIQRVQNSRLIRISEL